MSTPTTQAAGTPSASAAANTVVASSAAAKSSSASSPVVASTVTTSSSPKRTISLEEYQKARSNTVFARDMLQALFGADSDTDMEDGEQDQDTSSSRPPMVWEQKKTSRRSRVPEWQVVCQSWGALVENFNKDPAGYRERVRLARERYERFSKRPKIDRLHWGAVEAGNPCAVPMGIACEHCHVRAVPVSERDINGYTGVCVPEELKTLRTNLIAQMSLSAAGGCSHLPSAVGDYSSRSRLTSFGGFGGAGFLSPVRLAVGVETAGRRHGSGPPDFADRLEAVERLQSAAFAALTQDLALLKAQIVQVSQTASNVQVDHGSKLGVLRTRVGALKQALAPSHQD
ncbi:unnamed protein product [Phytophthora fragariaefolia]|uniref:Unnamed protein product n=1 Tax=Phytophthora fragariaefolia TaxID=1490495 RepID=A0A9W6TJM2_9STRA|nr:unnamed protein product [Phytophthora fragariaefolia]